MTRPARLFAAALMIACAGTAFAAGGKGGDHPLYRLSFKVKASGLQDASNFVVQDDEKVAFTVSGEKPMSISAGNDKTVDYKKTATSVNAYLVAEGGKVRVEIQFDLSGPVASADAAAPGVGMASFEYATVVTATKGKALVLVDDADRRVELTVDEVR